MKPEDDGAVPLKVLIVEDSEDDALLLLRELRRGGYAPVHERVETPEAMRAALEGRAWDVIVSDYRLPRFDAPAALALAREAGSAAPVVVVSGRIGEEDAVGAMKAGAHDYVMKGNLTRLCATIERGIAEAREHARAREDLRRRDDILDAVRFAAERLLGQPAGWEESVSSVLRRLGEAAAVSRVYLFENYTGQDGALWNLERQKWAAPSVTPGLTGDVRRFPYRGDGWWDFGRWEEVLGHGEPLYGNTRDFPEGERTFLAGELGILSMVLVPIFVEGGWWGFIGFDECEEEREWSAAEIGALGAAAGTLGAAIGRRRVEEQLRASEERYRAVIEQATDGIYLLDADTRCVLQTNPSFREMLGYAPDDLVGMPVYDFVAHPRENVDATIRRTLEQRSRVVGDRKYRRRDGTLLDVEVGVSVISQDGREVICTIVRDVTERARMQRSLEERVATLSRISAELTLDLPGESRLNALAESAVNASTAVACGVVLVGEDDRSVDLFGSHGLPAGYTEGLQRAYRDGVQSPSLEAFRTHRPVLVHDLRRVLLADPLYAPIHRFVRGVPWDIVYSLPLVSRGRALGAIFFCFLPDQEPGEDERTFLRAVVDQAAVAVENAGLFAEAREKAALEERQRLARELHDSVSQALYGIALGARTARERLAGDDRLQVAEPLDYVLSLTEAGMAEMRALIFELRPESLESEGLVRALEKQVAALDARHGIEVEDDLCDEPKASLQAKEALYRIAQEALHNTVKHARAAKVRIKLTCDAGQAAIEITDDGVGFEAGNSFPGHLGLRSMRERAARLGGTLEVRSEAGSGTTVRARVPVGI